MQLKLLDETINVRKVGDDNGKYQMSHEASNGYENNSYWLIGVLIQSSGVCKMAVNRIM